MLWAYFDETAVHELDASDGKHRPTEMIVGGCVAAAQKWERFIPLWRKALDDACVRTFHAKNFYSFRGEFNWLDDDNQPDRQRQRKLRDRLVDVILDNVDELIAFTSMVSIRQNGTRKAYSDVVQRALYDATKFRQREKESLYIVLARHPELSPWTILKWFEKLDLENKLAGCGVFRPDDVLPLQAADFVLHTMKMAWGGTATASLTRLKEGCLARNIPFHQQIASTADMKAILASRCS
jgi:hypothetical protein